MNFGVKVTFLIGLVSVNCIDLTDWKPIIGTSSNLKAIPHSILVDPSIVGSPSSSKSTITFNGQTITTSIGNDANTNDGIGSLRTVDTFSDFNGGAIDTEGRYLGYPGKVLSGFYSASPAVSSFDRQSTAFNSIGYYYRAVNRIDDRGKNIQLLHENDKSSIQFSIKIFAYWLLFYCSLFANTFINVSHSSAHVPISNHIVNQ